MKHASRLFAILHVVVLEKLWTFELGTKQSVRITAVQIHSFGSCTYLVHFNFCRKPGLAEPETHWVSHQLTFPLVGSPFQSDGSSRTRRVVTTRQHFEAVFRRSHRLLYLQTCTFFSKSSPTDISSKWVDFSKWRLVTNYTGRNDVDSCGP